MRLGLTVHSPCCSLPGSAGELASFYERRTVGEVLRLMRCSHGCGGRVQAAWLETGPVLNQRVRPRRVPLLGPEVRGDG